MAESQLKISQLRALVAVAEHRNFSAAALHLGLAQSTVSHAIASLETHLGVVLIARGRRGAVLTPTGEQISAQAAEILERLEMLSQTANLAREMQTGRVRVATVRSIATHVLPSAIAQFRQQHPGLTVEIAECDRYAEVEQTLRDGKADLGFTTLPAPPELMTWELFQDEYVALLPSGTLAEDQPLSWERLTALPMILNSRSPQDNQRVQSHLATLGYGLSVEYDVREDSTLISMVEKGLGSAITPRLVAAPIPPKVQVRSLPVPLRRAIAVAILQDALLPRAVFAFLDVLKA